MSLKFEIGATAQITVSGERGEIVARAEYKAADPSYLLQYQAADGRAVEQWWPESALAASH
jgi:hypothetical protein